MLAYLSACTILSDCPKFLTLPGFTVLIQLSAGTTTYIYEIYRICHELTVVIKVYETSLEKMLLSKPLASLITFFRTSLIKFYLTSHRISDSFYYITDSGKLI